MPGARVHEYGRCLFRRRPRRSFQCGGGPSGAAWKACHVGGGLRGEFLYAEELVGNRLGRPGVLLHSEECPGRLRPGIRGGASEKTELAVVVANPVLVMIAEFAHASDVVV